MAGYKIKVIQRSAYLHRIYYAYGLPEGKWKSTSDDLSEQVRAGAKSSPLEQGIELTLLLPDLCNLPVSVLQPWYSQILFL